MSESLLLQAFEGKNKTVPVWFMRQAGRYLPAYRVMREKYSLDKMFQTPELAASVTCLPLRTLDVDAAILFADILTLPGKMGFNISFSSKTGPFISNPISSPDAFKEMHDADDLSHVEETIKLVAGTLPAHIPLIGFAGSPFTVLCYLIEGGSAVNYNKTFRFASNHPEAFHKFLAMLTKNTIHYLKLQKKAGIKAFQLFDTWAGILRPADYAHWVLPYVQKIFEAVDLPSIYYVKNAAHLLRLVDQSKADFLSVCQTIVFGHDPILEKNHKGVQGNLFNGLLYADNKTLAKEVDDVLLGARHYSKYIFNLSHGVFPDVEVDKLKFIVDKVHKFSWKK